MNNIWNVLKKIFLALIMINLTQHQFIFTRGWGGGFGAFAGGALAGGLIGSAIAGSNRRSSDVVYVTQPAAPVVVRSQPIYIRQTPKSDFAEIPSTRPIKNEFEQRLAALEGHINTLHLNQKLLLEENQKLKKKIND